MEIKIKNSGLKALAGLLLCNNDYLIEEKIDETKEKFKIMKKFDRVSFRIFLKNNDIDCPDEIIDNRDNEKGCGKLYEILAKINNENPEKMYSIVKNKLNEDKDSKDIIGKLILDGYKITGKASDGFDIEKKAEPRKNDTPQIKIEEFPLQEIKFKDDGFKEILIKNLNELVICFNNQAYLASVILCGNIVEGILLIDDCKNTDVNLETLIKNYFEKNKNEPLKSLLDPVRRYRNCVHPTRQFSQSITLPDVSVAENCKNALIAFIKFYKEKQV